MKNSFDAYHQHYARMGNREPDWEAAARSPQEYACRKPWLPPDKAARILDFGCGWGHQLLGLWCAGYTNLEGVELVAEQAAVARRCSQERVPIACGDGREYLADKENAYDLIVLNDVFEHIPPPEALELLACLKAPLRPGGTLALRVPNMANLFAAYSRYMDISHVTGYTEQSLMQVLDQAGFVEHCLVLPSWPIAWRRGALGTLARTEAPLRADHWLHKLLYWLRGIGQPQCYSLNVEIFSRKPLSGAERQETEK